MLLFLRGVLFTLQLARFHCAAAPLLLLGEINPPTGGAFLNTESTATMIRLSLDSPNCPSPVFTVSAADQQDEVSVLSFDASCTTFSEECSRSSSRDPRFEPSPGQQKTDNLPKRPIRRRGSLDGTSHGTGDDCSKSPEPIAAPLVDNVE